MDSSPASFFNLTVHLGTIRRRSTQNSFLQQETPVGSHSLRVRGHWAQHSDTETDTEHILGLLPLPVCTGQRRLPRESPLVMAVEEVRVRPLRGLRDSRTLSSSRCLAFSDGNVALLLSTTLN